MANRDLTAEEVADAKRLKKLWQEKKDPLLLNQVKAAKALGYNSQGAVSQYLNGKVAMNFETVAKFAKLLKVNIDDISPQHSKLVVKPIPSSLDGFVAPTTGVLGGVATSVCLNWFAWHGGFCEQIGVDPKNLKLVRLDDDSFKEFPIGTVFLVDDSHQSVPKDGVYLLSQADNIIARRVTLADDVTISDGKKKQRLSRDAFGLLRIVGKVLSVFTSVQS
jgi:transcriptional regulator with XRE-family HTH domain